jgi:pSer/pThr/pTyr-binding forkhead associated (FHA) protein
MTEATIVGIEGMYRSAVIPIKPGAGIVFGRDAAVSHVVIDAQADLVSRKHCKISYQGEAAGFKIVDYSTKGTYVNGNRIGRGNSIAAKPGAIVSLGSSHNSFVLGSPIDEQATMGLMGE